MLISLFLAVPLLHTEALLARSLAYVLGHSTGTEKTTSPEVVRDPSLYPVGYFSGDPLPPSTIYLTFDDGPSDFTDSILDILKANGVPATFFINSFVRGAARGSDPYANGLLPRAETLKRMIHEGHVIGNHTFSHRNLATLSPEMIARELDLVSEHLHEVLGDETPTLQLIRPPFGSPWIGRWNHDEEKRKVCAALSTRGLIMMWENMWDSGDSAGWVKGEWYTRNSPLYHPVGTAYSDKVARQLGRLLALANGTASGVILMHDVHPTTRDMLDPLIKELKKRGYVFQTLEDYARWRYGPHVFDRFHINDPRAVPRAPELPAITQALLATRPFPPDQATAPRLPTSTPSQASAPRLVWGKPHPEACPLYDYNSAPKRAEFGKYAQEGLPVWFPRPILPPPSDTIPSAVRSSSEPQPELVDLPNS